MTWNKTYSQIDAGSTQQQVALPSVLIELRIENRILARVQNIRMSEDYAQQLLTELGTDTGVEFVPGIARGTGSISRIWTSGKSFKAAVAEAIGKPWKTISVRDFPEMELTVSDAASGKVLKTLIGVAIMSLGQTIAVGNNFITEDTQIGFIDVAEGTA